MLKTVLKQWAYASAPRLAAEFFSARARAHSQRFVAGIGCVRVNEALIARFGDAVVAGPFRGLKLSPMTHAEQIGPVLLGLYESELFPAWEVVFARRFPQIIDVGSKYGYYAVGLARRFPESRVVAFDTDRWARRATREMADANGASNVEILSYCDPRWLDEHLEPGSLIVSDCEGYENSLFCSLPVPNLATATLVIETHDCFAPGTTARLGARLAATHDVALIASEPSGRAPEVDVGFLNERDRGLATRELRQEQEWMLATPKMN